MTQANELTAPPAGTREQASKSLGWLFSWPLLAGMTAYLFCLYLGKRLLQDGDTLWHIAAGQWMLQNGFVPAYDPFSHTVRGAAWTAQEWLSEVILASAHDLGGWTGVMALTAFAFAATIALLTRTLLRSLEPVYALLFAIFAIAMTASHLLARPHILAMPLMMIWTIGLVRACESGRAPSLWLLPVMTVWANMHAGFTLGLLIAFAIALEPLLLAWKERRLAGAVRSWGIFLALAVASALVTPHGPQGILYTWQVFTESTYALDVIGEWRSPNFHLLQPLELWILGGLAVVLHQGLRFPPIRIMLLLGLPPPRLEIRPQRRAAGAAGPAFPGHAAGSTVASSQETGPAGGRAGPVLPEARAAQREGCAPGGLVHLHRSAALELSRTADCSAGYHRTYSGRASRSRRRNQGPRAERLLLGRLSDL